jgi:molybdenum cofactor cytidylyltransferase
MKVSGLTDLLVAVLAAGRGSRFGGGKLDAPVAEKPLGSLALDNVAAAGLPAGIIVVGDIQPKFAVQAKGWQVVTAPKAASGFSHSLRAAVQTARDANISRLLVLLADMPLVDPDHLKELAACRSAAATQQANGLPGVPALLTADLFGAIDQLTGDQGAAKLLAAHPDILLLKTPPDNLIDVDTEEDLNRVKAILSSKR